MTIPDHHCAKDTDLKRAMFMDVDEAFIALREAVSDLTNEQFWAYPVPGRHNSVTLVMHCLQQADEFNGYLQRHRGIKVRHEWQFMKHEIRFHLWDVPKDLLPKPGDDFPSVKTVLLHNDEIHQAIMANMNVLTEKDFVDMPVGQWPRLCDPFFRMSYHFNAHTRQIWLLRGHLGLISSWPQQHYA